MAKRDKAPTPDERAQAIIEGSPLTNGEGGHEGGAEDKSGETKSQRWRRLICQRMPKILHQMRRLIPLASRAQYEYAESEVRMVLQALDDARADIGRAFAGQREARATFRLD